MEAGLLEERQKSFKKDVDKGRGIDYVSFRRLGRLASNMLIEIVDLDFRCSSAGSSQLRVIPTAV